MTFPQKFLDMVIADRDRRKNFFRIICLGKGKDGMWRFGVSVRLGINPQSSTSPNRMFLFLLERDIYRNKKRDRNI